MKCQNQILHEKKVNSETCRDANIYLHKQALHRVQVCMNICVCHLLLHRSSEYQIKDCRNLLLTTTTLQSLHLGLKKNYSPDRTSLQADDVSDCRRLIGR